MIPSSFKISKDLLSQKSTKGLELEWMQEHPNQCRNTNISVMSKAMANDIGGSVSNLRGRMQEMVNSQMITRFGNKKRSNFFINYLHKDIPPYVLEKAPQEDRDARKMLEAGIKEGQTVDDVGCVVTDMNKELKKEDDSEEYPELDEIIEHISTEPVVVRQNKQTGSVNISITLNLNLNN